jgi:hypothetical protein
MNNLTDEEFFALYPQPYLQSYFKQPALFPFIQKPEPEPELVKEEEEQDRNNRIMASLLKKAEQVEIDDDLDETLVWENESDDEFDEETLARAKLCLADLARIARIARLGIEEAEATLEIPVLVRQTTGMVVDGKNVYNGCPSGARLLSNDGEYDLLFPPLCLDDI